MAVSSSNETESSRPLLRLSEDEAEGPEISHTFPVWGDEAA